MKILFVWDVAAVSCIFSKYLKRRGHECTVISRKSHDIGKFLEFYNEKPLDVSGDDFDKISRKMAEDYDIIHVNCIPYLAAEIKRDYPNKKVVLEYHGSDLRLSTDPNRIEYDKVVDRVLISTDDLMPLAPHAEYVPNPIDIEHFKPSEHKNGAVFIRASYFNAPKNIPFPVEVRPREFIPYSEMPNFFKQYSIYVDVTDLKEYGEVPSYSKTSLEALATGMSVFNYKREMVTGLPRQHTPEIATSLLERIYESL